MKGPHHWRASTVGHGYMQCAYCMATMMEAAAIGTINECDHAPDLEEAVMGIGFDLVVHLRRQREFSLKTFGPGRRTNGVLDHIRKEILEVEKDPGDLKEWVDLILLALDGAWRCGVTDEKPEGNEPELIALHIRDKQTVNEGRKWPDWRTFHPDEAIEHERE